MANFHELKGSFGRHVIHNRERYLYFSGTAYLGLSRNQKFIKHYFKGVKKFGLNNGTSRTNNIQLGIYDEFERYAAAYFDVADCAVVSSGYLAAQIAVKTLQKEHLVYAPHTHPSLWLNGNPNQELNFRSWLTQTIIDINGSNQKEWVLISNAMNNLYPEIYDFTALNQINSDKIITLILDDSHGIGINNGGKSAMASVPQQENIQTVVVASMAKALGVDAGIILSDSKNITKIKANDIFVGASPPAAAGLYAFMQSQGIYQEALEKLQINIEHFSQKIQDQQEWHFEPKFPVFLTQNVHLYEQLEAHKILIAAFPYPDRHGELISRVVLSSWHSKNDINKLLKAL